MNKSHVIALSAVSAALSTIALALGTVFSVLDISMLMIASACVMLPLTKDSLKGAFLSYGAAALLSLIFCVTFKGYGVVALYALFFGLHPIINYIIEKKRLNKYLFFAIKAAWFIGACFLMFYVFSVIEPFPDAVQKFAPLIISVGGLILFFIYDFTFLRLQKTLSAIIKRLNV